VTEARAIKERTRRIFALACAREVASVVARVASELFRVVRPGGTVGLTAWVPQGMFAELFAIGRRFAPPAPGAAREGLPGDAFEQLSQATRELIERHNVSTDGTLRIDADCLITVARKRG
jgi:hypothetical protein